MFITTSAAKVAEYIEGSPARWQEQYQLIADACQDGKWHRIKSSQNGYEFALMVEYGSFGTAGHNGVQYTVDHVKVADVPAPRKPRVRTRGGKVVTRIDPAVQSASPAI